MHAKLVARHPHVFGDVEAETAGRVRQNWERIKREDEGRDGRLPRRPRERCRAAATRGRCSGAPPRSASSTRTSPGALADLDDELRELRAELPAADPAPETEPTPRVAAELGDVLFACVNVARELNVDPELELRAATQRFRDRVESAERLAAADGDRLGRRSRSTEQDDYFDRAKEME